LITVSNTGTVTLGGAWSSSGTISDVNGSMNLGGTFSTSGLGTLVSLGGINITGTLTNDGTLSLTNATGSVNLRGGTINGGTVATTGSAELVVFYEGGTLNGVTFAGTLDEDFVQVQGGPLSVIGGMTLSNGTIKIGAGNVVHFSGTETLGGMGTVQFADNNANSQMSVDNNGALTIASGVTIHGTSGVIGATGSSVTNSGTVASDGGGTISLLGATNYATGALTGGNWQASNNSTLRIIGANVTTNAAGVLLDGAGSHVYSDTGTTDAFIGLTANAASGQFSIQNGANLNLGSATLTNAGTITIGASSTLAAGSYMQSAGATIVQGTLNAATVDLEGSTLSGTGMVTANVTNGGQVSPGSSPGLLTINGNYVQTSAGILNAEVGGSRPGVDYDQLAITGTATLGGTLNVTLINGFGPTPMQVFQIVTFASSSGSFATVNIPAINGSPAFVTQPTPSSFNLVGATSAADLRPVNINFTPASGTAGQNMTVNYTVNNDGTVAATGSWTDSIYLSTDGSLNANALLFGRATHTGDVAGMGSYTGSLTAPLPEGAFGNYQVIVLVDSREQVPDVNRANTLGTAPTALQINVPMLQLGGTVSGTIANGQDVYYHLVVPPTDDVTILASYAVMNQAEFYLRYLTLPDRTNFDQSVTDLSNLTPQLTLSDAQGGDYYILLHGREGAGTGQPFTLQATVVGLGITSVNPSSISNAGQATVTFTGRHFSPLAVVSLQTPAGVLVSPVQTTWQSSTTIVATFNLAGLPTGTYAARVDDNGQTAMLASALMVQPGTGTPGHFEAHISAVTPLRPFVPGIVDVEVSNPGDTDVPAGIFRIRAENAIMGLGDAIGTSFVVHLDTPNGSSLILPPHFDQHIRIGFQVINVYPHAPYRFFLSVSGATDATIDWTSIRDTSRPVYIDPDAWNAIFANFTAVVGSTVGQYQSALALDASYLTSLGENVVDNSRLLAFEMEKADDELPVPQFTSMVDDSLPTIGLPLGFSRSFAFSLSGRYHVGLFGRGWSTPWDMSALTDSNGNVTIQTGTSRRTFTLANGTFHGQPGDFAALTVDADGYHLVEASGTRYDFRPDGFLASISDPNGNRITAGYTGVQMTRLTASDGSVFAISYNVNGTIRQIADSFGRVISYVYDASGQHLISVTGPRGTVSYTYITGQGAATEHALASIAFPDGTHRYFSYDSQGRLVGTNLDNDAAAITFTYVSAGGVRATDATGGAQTTFYTESLQPAQIQDPLGHIQLLHYDSSHNLLSEGFLGGPTYSFLYDAQGDVVETVDPLGHTTHAGYQTQPARLTSFRDENRNTTAYSYDSHGNLLTVVTPDGSTTQYGYDGLGEVTQSTNPGQSPIRYAYDGFGHLIRKDFPDGTHADYAYDAHGNLITASDSSGTTTLHYDSADRLIEIDYPNGRFLHYTYDSGGRRAQSVDQDGFTVNYSYDAAGRLAELTDAAAATIVGYTYDPAGRIAREDLGNGTATSYSYDAAGHLTQLTNLAPGGAINSQFTYTYDAFGRRVSMTSQEGTTAYGYDDLGQLISVSLPGGRQIAYQYDAAGNRVAEIDNGVETDYTTNSLTEYVSVGPETNTYDPAGDLTATSGPGGDTNYTYNFENHLIGVATATNTWSYQYDALGQRIAATHNGQTTNYLVDPLGLGNVVGEYNQAGQVLAHYTFGYGLISQTAPATGTAYYDFDGTQSTVGLTGAAGTYENRYDYLPFGESSSSTEQVRNPFQFAGQIGVMDDGNGLDFIRTRYYSPSDGRFTGRDPAGLAGGVNLYAYVGNDPTNFFDPSGQGAVDYNFTYAQGGAITFGFYHDLDTGRISPYAGIGIGMGGPGFAVTYADTGASGGVNVGLSVGWNHLAGQVGLDEGGNVSYEYGLGGRSTTFGWSLIPTYVVNAPLPEATYITPNPAYESTLSPEQLCQMSNENPGSQNLCLGGMSSARDISSAAGEVDFSSDPNEIAGPAGFGAGNFVGLPEVFPYRIDFQNQPTASAPAQQVVITQQLDPSLDLSTFELGDFGFGGQTFSIPAGLQFYHTRIDDRASRGVFVDVTAAFDTSTDTLTWTFTSLDPATLDLPADITVGFLPPDTTAPEGEGFVSYIVQPRSDLSTGTAINAQASIVFDTNAPVATNTFNNTIDAGAPTSSVVPLPPRATSTNFTVSWSGQDDTGGSGIASFGIFVSDNGGPFTPFLTATTQTSATFTGQFGHTYGFYSVATDNVGNRQPTPTAAQVTIQLIDPFLLYVTALYHTVLSRTPSASEVTPWVQFLDSGGTQTRVAQVFWESQEHRGIQIDGYYQTYLGRIESPAERAHWIAAMLGGLTEVQVVHDFLGSPEYQAAHASNTSFIDSLYTNLLSRTETTGERNAWLQFLQTGGTRERIEQLFLASGERDTRVVDSYYANLLGRTPDQSGSSAWINLLLGGQGTWEGVAEAFLASNEFYARSLLSI
jgi:RHS repeat-associated protein